jgi:soluble lytic murein transglycosylase-like protein
MRAAALAALALALAVSACGDGAPAPPRVPAQKAEPAALPAPDAALPTSASALAADLVAADDGLREGIEAWTGDGPPARSKLPRDVALFGLRQQRILRFLSREPRLARRVLARVPSPRRPAFTSILRAMRDLTELNGPPPKRRPRIRTGRPAPPEDLLRWYRRARGRFGVGVHVLAAVNFVETAFNKLRNRSTAGAQGPMQFIPSTWAAYGLGGDIRDPRDAILGAANYLHANGAPRDYPRALYRYNPSRLYVDAVLRYARLIARDRRWLYAFYSWQVFIRSRSGGERRVTGPAGPGLAPTR